MSFKRINGRIDINSCIEDGTIIVNEEEQRGARTNKFWFNDYAFMYKDIYQLSYEDYAEMIAYRLAKHLNIECANYDLAIYNGNSGVITSSLITDNKNEELFSGTEIITQVYTEYIVPIIKTMEEYYKLINVYNAKNVYEFSKLPLEKQIDLKNKLIYLVNDLNINNKEISKKILENTNIDLFEIEKIYEYLDSFDSIYNQDFTEMKNGIIKANNLYDIWNVLEIYSKLKNVSLDIVDCMNKLINMFIFDIITSQGDRHADNWSIIKNSQTNSIRICPLYDNSNICSLNRVKAIKSISNYVELLNNSKNSIQKKQKIKERLKETINHSKSGLKIDLDDIEQKNQNKIMLAKFLNVSSQEFNDKIKYFADQINENVLDEIFIEIEKQTNQKMPHEVKIITKTIIFNNLEMINEIFSERGILK